MVAQVVSNEIYLQTPREFDFSQCLRFLNRNHHECLHRIDGDNWIKMVKLAGEPVIVRVSKSSNCLRLAPLNTSLSPDQQSGLISYIREVFDLDRDLRPFYDQLNQDQVIGSLCQNYYGLRLLGIPDLFEALCWCIIGQQINLTFAYKLKRRLVEARGESLNFEGINYRLFPTPLAIARMSEKDFTGWQYSGSKAAYLVGIAREIQQGDITRDQLLVMTPEEAYNRLLQLKGIGPWSAQYVMMKCLRINTAFPVEDVGLQNAVRIQMRVDTKPSLQELVGFGNRWNPWQAYATFYLWHSLI